MATPNLIELISQALKLKDELVAVGKKINESIESEKNKKRRKRLKKACDKALGSGSDIDLADVRRLMFPYVAK